MKFLIMLQGTQSDYDAMEGSTSKEAPAWTQDEVREMVRFMQKLNEDLAASGELLEGQGLTAPSQARVVTTDDNGRPVAAHDGYGEGQEVLVGYWLLECESIDRATEIAARVHRCPVPEGTSTHPVIVRPVQEEPPVAG